MGTSFSKITLILAAFAFIHLSSSQAQVVINYDASAPDSNFGTPTNSSNTVAYTIDMTADSANVYLNIVARPDLGGALSVDYTNLYFSTGVAVGSGGSNIGFEIGNKDAFIPGGSGTVPTADYATAHTPGNWSITIPWTFFENDPYGVGFNNPITSTNNILRLNLSQSFGNSVAGGQTSYGDSRLGEVTYTATPEPSAGMLMLGGLGLLAFQRFVRLRRGNCLSCKIQ